MIELLVFTCICCRMWTSWKSGGHKWVVAPKGTFRGAAL